MPPTRLPEKRYFLACVLRSSSPTFNIITTNKKRTATAPTYTISKIIAKNSAPAKTKIPDEFTNAKIKKRTECTGFLELITAMEDSTVILANNKKNKLNRLSYYLNLESALIFF